MNYKKKYIIPLNFKAILVYVFGLIAVALFVATAIHYIQKEKWSISIACCIFTLLFIVGYIIFCLRGLRFETDKIVLPKEYNTYGKQTDCQILYTEIKRIEFIKKNEKGPHIKGVFGNLNSIVITDKKGKKYLLSVNYYTKKQITFIIEETLNRAKLTKIKK